MIREHTVIGERILRAVPEMAEVATKQEAPLTGVSQPRRSSRKIAVGPSHDRRRLACSQPVPGFPYALLDDPRASAARRIVKGACAG